MADQAPDVNTEVVAQETTPTDSSPVETNTPEVAEDPTLKALEADDDEPTNAETEDVEPEETPQDPVDETETEEQPLGKADERKQQLNTEIRDLVSQRNEIKAEVERLNALYTPQSVDELVEQGLSETDARVAAMEQREELRVYNDRVVEAQLTIGNESEKVIRDFPIFDPDSPEFKPEIAAQAAELLEKNLIKDPNTGQIIGSHVTPYQLYKPIADAYKQSAIEGQIKGRKASEKMLSAAEAPSSAAPRTPKVDPVLAALSSDD